MGYKRAEDVLPAEVLSLVQEFVDGQMLYVPKKKANRNSWGSVSGAKEYLKSRNARIYAEFENGTGTRRLAEKYFLSEKTIQGIVRDLQPSQSESIVGSERGFYREQRE